MANLNEQLNELQIARDEMKIALLNKGQSVTKDIRTYANAISNIVIEQNGEIVTKEGIKLFKTTEEMNSDLEAKEGDLAVIYREDISNWNGNTPVSQFVFPRQVVLSQVGEGYCYGYASSGSVYVDIDSSISATGASFRIYGNSSCNIQYTSEDGLIYNRTDSYADTIVISDSPIAINMYEWSDICGNFMLTGGNVFEGLFEFTTDYVNKNFIKMPLLTDLSYTLSGTSISEASINTSKNCPVFEVSKIQSLLNKYKEDGHKLDDMILYVADDDELYLIDDNSIYNFNYVTFDPNNNYLGLSYSMTGASTLGDSQYYVNLVHLDLDSQTYNITKTISGTDIKDYSYSGTSSRLLLSKTLLNNTTYLPMIIYTSSINESCYLYICTTSSSSTKYSNKSITYTPYNIEDLYLHASTQLTLTKPNQILAGVKGYGPNGVIEGDGSIYQSLDKAQIDSSLFNGAKDLTYNIQCNNNKQGLFAIKPTMNYLGDNVKAAYIQQKYVNCATLLALKETEEGFLMCTHAQNQITIKHLDKELNEISTKDISISNCLSLAGKIYNNKLYVLMHNSTANATSGGIKVMIIDIDSGNIEYTSPAYFSSNYIKGQIDVDTKTNILYFCVQSTGNSRYHYAYKVNLNDYSYSQLYKLSSSSGNGGMASSKNYIAMMVAGNVYLVLKGSETVTTLATGHNSNSGVFLAETDTDAYYTDGYKTLYKFEIGSTSPVVISTNFNISYQFFIVKIEDKYYFGADSGLYESTDLTTAAYRWYVYASSKVQDIYPILYFDNNRVVGYNPAQSTFAKYICFNYTEEESLANCQTDSTILPVYCYGNNRYYFLSADWMNPNK